ncbi:hypothetical protein [Actinoallomurus liliacearum]
MSERDHHPFRGLAWGLGSASLGLGAAQLTAPNAVRHMSRVDDSAVARVLVPENDFAANAVAPVCFDTEPSGGCRHPNHGIDECPGGGRPARHGNDGQSRSMNRGL